MAKLTFTFDTENAEDLKLLKALPLFKSGSEPATTQAAEEKPAKPKKEAKKQDKKEKAKPEEQKEEAAEETDHDISIEEIRELVSEKAKGGHRKEIKAKFEEFDVKNVTSLPEDKYPEFKEFLEALK